MYFISSYGDSWHVYTQNAIPTEEFFNVCGIVRDGESEAFGDLESIEVVGFPLCGEVITEGVYPLAATNMGTVPAVLESKSVCEDCQNVLIRHYASVEWY